MEEYKSVNQKMIPKQIFYVWGAKEPKKRDVLACIQTWRQICPDYKIIEINEDSTEYFNFKKELESNKWFSEVYNRKLWAYVSDYIRVKVLYLNGGIYLDTDVSVLKKFDDFLTTSAFVGLQNTNFVEPAILGSRAHNPFFKKILDFYSGDIWNEPIYSIPKIFGKFFKELYGIETFPEKEDQEIVNLDLISIYPERYFIPYRYSEGFDQKCIEKDTVTIHWFNGSWLNKQALLFLENKHKKNYVELASNESGCKYYLFKVLPICNLSKVDNETKVVVLNIPILSFSKNILKICGITLIKVKRF